MPLSQERSIKRTSALVIISRTNRLRQRWPISSITRRIIVGRRTHYCPSLAEIRQNSTSFISFGEPIVVSLGRLILPCSKRARGVIPWGAREAGAVEFSAQSGAAPAAVTNAAVSITSLATSWEGGRGNLRSQKTGLR